MGKAVMGLFGGTKKPQEQPKPAQPALAARDTSPVFKGVAGGNTDPNSVGQVRIGGGVEKRRTTVPGLSL